MTPMFTVPILLLHVPLSNCHSRLRLPVTLEMDHFERVLIIEFYSLVNFHVPVGSKYIGEAANCISGIAAPWLFRLEEPGP